MTYLEQLKELLQRYSVAELAGLLNVTERSILFWTAEENSKKPHQKTIRNIDELYERLVKQGNRVVKTETGKFIAEGYAPIIKTSQTGEPGNFIEQRLNKKNHHTPTLVPFIPVKAQAGYVKALDQEIYLDNLEKYALPPGVSGHGAIWRYWEIEGDSMLPVFRSGDIILTSFVHPMDWENIRNFYTYVIVTQERVIIKRVYCKNSMEWVLISENEDNYPQQLLRVEDIKEVWVYRKTWATRAEPTKKFDIKI